LRDVFLHGLGLAADWDLGAGHGVPHGAGALDWQRLVGKRILRGFFRLGGEGLAGGCVFCDAGCAELCLFHFAEVLVALAADFFLLAGLGAAGAPVTDAISPGKEEGEVHGGPFAGAGE